MGVGPGMLSGVNEAFRALLWIALISVPLAFWKLVDIIVWLIHNLRVTIGG